MSLWIIAVFVVLNGRIFLIFLVFLFYQHSILFLLLIFFLKEIACLERKVIYLENCFHLKGGVGYLFFYWRRGSSFNFDLLRAKGWFNFYFTGVEYRGAFSFWPFVEDLLIIIILWGLIWLNGGCKVLWRSLGLYCFWRGVKGNCWCLCLVIGNLDLRIWNFIYAYYIFKVFVWWKKKWYCCFYFYFFYGIWSIMLLNYYKNIIKNLINLLSQLTFFLIFFSSFLI